MGKNYCFYCLNFSNNVLKYKRNVKIYENNQYLKRFYDLLKESIIESNQWNQWNSD